MILAGGTGGHVFPALAVANYLSSKDVPLVWVGTKGGLETKLINHPNIAMEWLFISGLRGKKFTSWIKAPIFLFIAALQSVFVLLKYRPCIVLGMGGFVSGPTGIIAALFGVPLFIHEQNTIPGLTNRILKIFSKKIFLGFPGSINSKKAVYTGNPLRQDICDIEIPPSRLSRDRERLHLLVVGGSLGAKIFNEIVPQALSLISEDQRPEVQHQAGKTIDVARTNYNQHGVEANVIEFINDMSGAYVWADIVLCRAGALTVSELTAAGVASILVPYPHSVDNHQHHNASFLVSAEAAILMLEENFYAKELAAEIQTLSIDKQRILTMSINARNLFNTNAVFSICESILKTRDAL
jgi:UDP-N-acetylglucosamine--N-acetylmuramyl-(pentapeptide) pyrophosphoryl-undecaprenol N-acetylglucosamine transferase